MYGLAAVDMPSWLEEGPGESGSGEWGIAVASPTSGSVGDTGGDLDLCRLFALLFGRGGGGRPMAVRGDGGRERGCSSDVRDALVCSSYSRAARRFGEIIMFLDRGRGAYASSLRSSASADTLMTCRGSFFARKGREGS